MLMPPKGLTTASTSAGTWSALDRSLVTVNASIPCFFRSALASSSSCGLRALMAIFAPISPKPLAICNPRPRDPPVTSATLPPSSNRSRNPTLSDLEQPCGSLSAADAHGDHHQLGAASLSLDERMTCQTRTAHTIRVAYRNSAAVHVQAVIRNPQLVAAIQHLNGKGLVQFP